MELLADDLSQLRNDDEVDVAKSQHHLGPVMKDAMGTEVGDESPLQELVEGVGNTVYGDTGPALDSTKVMMELRAPSISRMGSLPILLPLTATIVMRATLHYHRFAVRPEYGPENSAGRYTFSTNIAPPMQ